MKEKPIFKFALREDLIDNKEFLPTRAEPLATGWDVRAAQEDREPIILEPGQYCKIPLGFRSFCPSGWWYELKPRSSSFTKKYLHALYGTIDESWEGESLLAAMYSPDNGTKNLLVINFGDAIGQIIPVKRKEMIVEEVLNEEYDSMCKRRNSLRGAQGFGSTTK